MFPIHEYIVLIEFFIYLPETVKGILYFRLDITKHSVTTKELPIFWSG